jgi:hypothetical protein
LPATALSVQIFDPLLGTKAIGSLQSVSSFAVTVPDHPILIFMSTISGPG